MLFLSALRVVEAPVVMMVAKDLLDKLVNRENREHAETLEHLELL